MAGGGIIIYLIAEVIIIRLIISSTLLAISDAAVTIRFSRKEYWQLRGRHFPQTSFLSATTYIPIIFSSNWGFPFFCKYMVTNYFRRVDRKLRFISAMRHSSQKRVSTTNYEYPQFSAPLRQAPRKLRLAGKQRRMFLCGHVPAH